VGDASADAELVVPFDDAVETGHVADVDHERRRGKAQLEERQQAVAARQDLGVAGVLAEDAQHLADVPRPGVLELGRDHRGPSSVAALTGGDTADAAERAHTTRLPQGIRGDRRRASLMAISRPAGRARLGLLLPLSIGVPPPARNAAAHVRSGTMGLRGAAPAPPSVRRPACGAATQNRPGLGRAWSCVP
jgi:hypothetical protein